MLANAEQISAEWTCERAAQLLALVAVSFDQWVQNYAHDESLN